MMVLGQTQSENYTKVTTYKTPTSVTIQNPSDTNAKIDVTYYDGLGRPVQKIANKQSATGNNIVTHIEYDQFGRVEKDYLPYVSTNGTLDFDSNGQANTLNYTDYQGQNPYSKKFFEASPLNRVLKQAAPGLAWEGHATDDNDHAIKFVNQTNDTIEVKKFKATTSWDVTSKLYNPTLVDDGFYLKHQLYKTITKDENWTSGTNNTTEEFKDKEGKVILKRTYGESNVNGNIINVVHDTYYIYDQYGNLTFVIPPKVDTSNTISTTILDGLCYQYKYDYRNRLVEKKLPGKQWEYIVYDKLDRVVATGPALSPFSNLQTTPPAAPIVGWMLTKYDVFSRPVYTGWVQSTTVTSAGRKILQDAQNALTTSLNENKTTNTTTIDGVTTNYSNVVAPTSFKLLTVNYYDDYSYPNAPTVFGTVLTDNSGVVYYNNSTNKPKGLPTGSWVRVPELSTTTPVKFELSYTLFDYKARPIRNRTTNYLGGYTQIDSKLDFIGKTLYTETKHKRLNATPTELYLKDAFTYSNQDRLLTHTHQIGLTGIPELLADNTYNELGQLVSKKVGRTVASPLQKVDYSYNIRGWLTEINKVAGSPNPLQQGTDPLDLFAFKINYNTVQNETNYIGKELYNGNISETYWRTSSDNVLRKYGYFYDDLNRLKNAVYQKPGSLVAVTNSYNESLSYDKNGNITALQRNGEYEDNVNQLQTDNLNYFYPTNSNRLMKVTDATNNSKGFIDDSNGTNDTVDDYSYDANGNMITDQNKAITSIKYNHLNLPSEIVFIGTNRKINYLYNSTGVKVKKVVTNGTATTTDYLSGFQYVNTILEFFPTAEGYVKNTVVSGVNNYNYIYNYTDHLGNIRLSYTYETATSSLQIVEENNYYPFGLKQNGFNMNKKTYDWINGPNAPRIRPAVRLSYQYRYNSKEYQDELGLNMYDYGNRNYDPAIGRWNTMDKLSELYFDKSSYVYALNTPVQAIDPDGNVVIFINGMHLGDGGKPDYWRTYEKRKTYNYTPFGNVASWENVETSAFDRSVMNHLGDQNAIYRDGRSAVAHLRGDVGSIFDPYDRSRSGYQQGKEDAKGIIANLARDKTTGEIVETIKIITHSMGAAYGKGYVEALQEYIKTLPKEQQSQIKISLVADFDPFQAGYLKANKDVYTQQFTHLGGFWGLAEDKQEGVDDYTESNGVHSIFSFFSNISSLQEGTYKWNGTSWICTTCN
jgi:RHS repeat-associated protein